MYWYAPWLYGYLSPDKQSLLSYGNFGAMIEPPEWWYQLNLIVILVIYAGLFKFREIFRWLYLFVTVFLLVTSPIYGVSIITGIEVFITGTSTMLNGFILALAFYSPLKEKFLLKNQLIG